MPTFADKPAHQVRIEFAKRLQTKMISKGWNQSELARRANKCMIDGRMGRDDVSGYLREKSLPGPNKLDALSKALNIPPGELLPSRGISSAADKNPALHLRETDDGNVWLRVNQTVTWPKAMQILQILKNEDSGAIG